MANQNEYTELIAGAHRDKERFTEWVFHLTEQMRIARDRLSGMVDDFNLDLAQGAQLDAIGVRVGVTRRLKTSVSDVFFAFDDVDGIGFDYGIWKTPRDDAFGVTELGDDIYRAILKAKIALNQYGGKNEDIRAMLDIVADAFGLSPSTFAYVDGQDMSITIYIKKDAVPPIVWKIFKDGIFTLNHAGVALKIEDGIAGTLAALNGDLLTSDSNDLYLIDIK